MNKSDKLNVKVYVSVKNIGDYKGKEVVQLYLEKPTKKPKVNK